MSESVLPMFSSRSFIVSGLTFRSLIHFEFFFVYGVRKCSSFILLQVVFHVLDVPLLAEPLGRITIGTAIYFKKDGGLYLTQIFPAVNQAAYK